MIIAQYKFDKSIYDNLIPEFNSEFTNYEIEDTVDGEVVTRVIYSDSLPTEISFEGGLALLELEFLEISGLTSLRKMFYNCNNVTHINTDNWDTNKITDISDMFFYCTKLTILNLTHWDVSNVTTMAGLFNGCKGLISIKLNNWDLSSCSQIQYMFYGCESLEEIDLSNWDVSHITSVNSLFYNCKQLSILNLTGWNLDSIELTENMFVNCSDLITIIMTDSNPETVNRILLEIPPDDYTEAGAINIIALNVDTNEISVPSNLVESVTINQFAVLAKYKFNKNIDTVPVINNNANFEYVLDDIDNGDDTITRTVKTSSNIIITSLSFQDCTGLLEVYELNMMNLTTASRMFSGCSNLTSVAINKWLITNITDSSYMFDNCTSLQSIDLTKWYNDKIQSMAYMFNNCSSLTSLDISNFDTSKVTNMKNMFNGCNNLTSLDVSNFDTSNVETIECMFAYCSNLLFVDGLNNMDVSKVNNMGGLFTDCSKIQKIEVSNWDVSKVTNFGAVFRRCSSLNEIDVSKWDTSNGIIMSGIFTNCNNLTIMDLSSWVVGNANTISQMFYGCKKLATLTLFKYVDSNVQTTYLFGQCTALNKVKSINSDYNTINILIDELLTRTEENPGILDIQGVDNLSLVDLELAKSKHWNVYDKANCKLKFIVANKKSGKIKHCERTVCIITTHKRKI